MTEPVLRRIGLCRKCVWFTDGEAYAFLRNDKSTHSLICMLDSSVEHNGLIFPKITGDEDEYATYEVPKECPYWAEQCMENWNEKNKTSDGCQTIPRNASGKEEDA